MEQSQLQNKAPSIATWLAATYGLASVGLYLSAAGLITLAALLWMRPASSDSGA